MTNAGNFEIEFAKAARGLQQTKKRVALEINKTIRARRMSQIDAAALLGIAQPKISALANYHLAGFSLERLLRLANAIGLDIEIIVRKKQSMSADGGTRVTAA